VLVADDQIDVVTALRLLLRRAGFEADAAASVQEVRERLSGAEYDLLLMDLNYARDTTSGREGLELLAEVHAGDSLLPVVVMTGWGSIETAVEAMRRGARTFVHKPWDNATLVATLRREVDDGRVARCLHREASREHEDAQAIQRALLPADLPVAPGVEIGARWQPASSFGGDCYDLVPLGGSRLAISIADVCGKGLPAALLMAHLQASSRAAVVADPSPGRVAARVNRELMANARLCRLVTAFWAVYDTPVGRLRYTNAGHNPPLLVRADGAVSRLAVGGMVLGACEGSAYDEAEITLGRGDRLLLYTDGITEADGDGDELYGDQRLEQAVGRFRQLSAGRMVDRLFEDAAAFTGGRFRDDATMLAVAIA
jgi:sigma-B regulation protein RsbU (phosphoserine phosphatase)